MSARVMVARTLVVSALVMAVEAAVATVEQRMPLAVTCAVAFLVLWLAGLSRRLGWRVRERPTRAVVRVADAKGPPVGFATEPEAVVADPGPGPGPSASWGWTE